MSDIHRASSQSWGDQACARICQIVLESNTGMAQQVMENRTDLLDLYTVKELSAPDDLGLTLPFLAVFYDRPEILQYLHKRGVDLVGPCDPMGFGNPIFYATSLKRYRLISTLHSLGTSVFKPCDSLQQVVMTHANRLDDDIARNLIGSIGDSSKDRATILLRKNMLRIHHRKKYKRTVEATKLINRVIRGFLGRARCRRLLEGQGGRSRAQSRASGVDEVSALGYDDDDYENGDGDGGNGKYDGEEEVGEYDGEEEGGDGYEEAGEDEG